MQLSITVQVLNYLLISVWNALTKLEYVLNSFVKETELKMKYYIAKFT